MIEEVAGSGLTLDRTMARADHRTKEADRQQEESIFHGCSSLTISDF
jgi:hypothetical protein